MDHANLHKLAYWGRSENYFLAIKSPRVKISQFYFRYLFLLIICKFEETFVKKLFWESVSTNFGVLRNEILKWPPFWTGKICFSSQIRKVWWPLSMVHMHKFYRENSFRGVGPPLGTNGRIFRLGTQVLNMLNYLLTLNIVVWIKWWGYGTQTYLFVLFVEKNRMSQWSQYC